MKWIKHDADANQDAKLQNVLLDYGLEGYGLYWYCIELIAGKVDKDNITFELEHDARIIARNTGSSVQKVEEMMKYFVNIGLFENTAGVVTCLKLAKRLDKSMTSNPEMRIMIEKLRDKSHDKVMTQSAEPMQDKIRLDKNRIDKDIKHLSSKHDTRPTVKKSKYDDLAKEIFNHWVSVMKKSGNVKLTKERKNKIIARLKDGYEIEDFKKAIFGCSITPHNMGKNENGKLYNDIELICRTATHLERFVSASESVSTPNQYHHNTNRKKSLMERSYDDAQTALSIIERREQERQACNSDVLENEKPIRSQMGIEGRPLS